MAEDILTANMLGEFSLTYRGKRFFVERNITTKMNRLLQIVLYQKKGLARGELYASLFEGDNLVDPANSYRAIMFRMRKLLPEYGLPAGEYITCKKNEFHWTTEIPTENDAEIFEKKADKALAMASSDEKGKAIREAFDMYGGDFLPGVSGVWVEGNRKRLRTTYDKCFQELKNIYTDREEYDKLLEIAERANSIYPYGMYQVAKMQALMALGKEREALIFYNKNEQQLFKRYGTDMPEDMRNLLRQLSRSARSNTKVISEVQLGMESMKEEKGAFYCSYPVFVDTYRYMRRLLHRLDMKAYLMLCTFTDRNGVGVSDEERCEELAKSLTRAIKASIRGGDMFTRYSDNQFIIFLVGLENQDCSKISERILRNMAIQRPKKYVKFSYASINSLDLKVDTEDRMLGRIAQSIE